MRRVQHCRLSHRSGRDGLQGAGRRGLADRLENHCQRLRRRDRGRRLLECAGKIDRQDSVGGDSLHGRTAERQTIEIGNAFDTDEGDRLYYAKGSETDTVFTIPGLLFDQRLNNAQEALRDRRFVEFEPNSLSTIEITQSNRSVSLQKLETGAWQVLSRDNDGNITANPADTKILAELVGSLFLLRAQNFVSDAPSNADLENYGFTDPQRVIQLKGGTPLKLIIGDLVEGNVRHAYAKLEKDPFIYEVDTSILSDFHTRPFNYHLRLLHEEPENAKLVGITIRDTESDNIVYNAVLNEVTPTWEEIAEADELDEESKESLLSLVEQSSQIEAREFIQDEFGNVPWKYRLDLLYESSENTETPAWTTQLWVSERLTGTNAIAGIEAGGHVFYMTQRFIDAFFKLTFKRFDPGPEPEPTTPPEASTQPDQTQAVDPSP